MRPVNAAPDTTRLVAQLRRLAPLLDGVEGNPGARVHHLLRLAAEDEGAFWRLLDANELWGGAGSVASATLAPNPGQPDAQWRDRVREMREILMDIGASLMERGRANPGIASWVLAFSNWNRNGI